MAYQPIRTPTRKLTATPTPMGMSGFHFQMEDNKVSVFQLFQDFHEMFLLFLHCIGQDSG